MIKKLFYRFSLKTAERDLKAYLDKLCSGHVEQLAMILAHSLLVYSQLLKLIPGLKKLIDSSDEGYDLDINDLVIQTNSLAKEYQKDSDGLNAAGTMLWNHTFRCLRHPELKKYGQEIWKVLNKTYPYVRDYFNELKQRCTESKNLSMVEKINEAENYIGVIPEKFKDSV